MAAFSCCVVAAAQADLLRTGDTRWLVVASTGDVDKAIGIARAYRGRFDDVRVVEASNGWLAVIAGPVSTSNGLKAALKTLTADGSLPTDAFLSDGQRFSRTVWVPKEATPIPSWEYSSSRPLTTELDGFEIVVSDSAGASADLRVPVISVRKNGRLLIEERLSEAEISPDSMNAEVKSVRLDPSGGLPQIMFSAFWMGAHCCTVTKFLLPKGENWSSIAGRTLDGGGYHLEDLDDDGTVELLSNDNSFLYAFAPYAGSWAPLVVEKLIDGRLNDMRWSPEFLRHYRRELYGWEHQASVRTELWQENGFLGAWVAMKAVVGELDDAWKRMLVSYDRSSDWPLTECTLPLNNGVCPEGSERQISFPQALQSHLARSGYILDRKLPDQTPSAPEPPRTEVAKSDPAPTVRERSAGTGFVVSKDGPVVTNYHVVRECQDFEIKLSGQPVSSGRLVASDATNDLALLQLSERLQSVAPVRLEIRLGELVAVFGYPLAQVLSSSGNFTLGNITALTGIGDDTRFLQISAPVQPGNSGGPLLDKYGNVVGVVTSKLNALTSLAATGDIPQNVNFAIRSSSLYAFLLAHGVQPEAAATETELDAPDLAERAAGFSAAVVCQ